MYLHLKNFFHLQVIAFGVLTPVVSVDVDCPRFVWICLSCNQKLATIREQYLLISLRSLHSQPQFARGDLSDRAIFARGCECHYDWWSLVLLFLESLTCVE